MNSPLKIGIGFGVGWCLVKYISFLINPLPDNILPTVLLNILFLLTAIALALYQIKRNQAEEDSALGDIKNGLKAGLPYTVLVASFLYLFYGTINPEFNQKQIEKTNARIEKDFNNPIEYETLKKSNPTFEVMTKEELKIQMKKGPQTFYTPGITMTVSLLAMLLLSTLYSILVSVIYRRIVFRH